MQRVVGTAGFPAAQGDGGDSLSEQGALVVDVQPASPAAQVGLKQNDVIVKIADHEIASRVPRKQIEHAFNLARQLKNVDKIFARVFGKKKPGGVGEAGKKSARKR